MIKNHLNKVCRVLVQSHHLRIGNATMLSIVLLSLFLQNALSARLDNCWETEELGKNAVLARDASEYYDCDEVQDGDFMSYKIEPAYGYEDNIFQVFHYIGDECDTVNPDNEPGTSCETSTGFCGMFDVELEDPLYGADNNTAGNNQSQNFKSCIQVKCKSSNGCRLFVDIWYYPYNVKAATAVSCTSYVFDYAIAENSHTVLYCSLVDGLDSAVKLDYFIEAANDKDEFEVIYTTDEFCSDTVDYVTANAQRYVKANSCDTPDDQCEENGIKINPVPDLGACLMIQCVDADDGENCYLDWSVEFYDPWTFGKQVRCQFDTHEDFKSWDGELRYYCDATDGLKVGDDFEMDIQVSDNNDDFKVFHMEGSDCDREATKNNAITGSSCTSDVDKCIERDTVIETTECVVIQCGNPFTTCNIDIFIEWSDAPRTPILVCALLSILAMFYAL